MQRDTNLAVTLVRVRIPRSHPQVYEMEIVTYVSVFDCRGCGRGSERVAYAVVQPDGSLFCHWCAVRAGTARIADRLDWCPVCKTAKPAGRWSRFSDERQCPECASKCADERAAELVGTCAHCAARFTRARRNARYCSGRCRVAAHRAHKTPTA